MTESKKPKRRWLSYGLRSFFILLTLLCIFLGWIGTNWLESKREEAAVEKIIAAGGLIGYDYEEPGYYVIGPSENKPYGHAAFRYLFGEHIFSRVVAIDFRDGINRQAARPNEVAKEIAQLRCLKEIEFHTDGLLEKPMIDSLLAHPYLESVWFAAHSISPEQLRYLSRSKSIQQVLLTGHNATDDHLRQLQLFPNLTIVSIRSNETTNAGFLYLGNVAKLERLYVENPNLTDEGLVSLTKLKNLKEFSGPSGWGGLVTANCLPTLCQITSLEELSISFNQSKTEFNVAQYSDLELLINLKKLTLYDENLEDDAISIIGKLEQLQELALSGTKTSDAGLTHLSNLHQLESLDLNYTEVTDAGLKKLENLDSLKRLEVSIGNGVTNEYLRSQGFRSEDDGTDWYVR